MSTLKNNKFSILPVTYDETFLSWVTRCSLSPKIYRVTRSDINKWHDKESWECLHDIESIGMDFDYINSIGGEIANKLEVDIKILECLFSPNTELLLSGSYRLAYCHKCISSDVSSKRYPSWKKKLVLLYFRLLFRA